MTDPVVIETGESYERDAIKKWFATNDTCPKTGNKIKDKTIMVANIQLRQAIEEIKKELEKNNQHVSKIKELTDEEFIDKIKIIIKSSVAKVFNAETSYGKANKIAVKISGFVEKITSSPAFGNIALTKKLEELANSKDKMSISDLKETIDAIYNSCAYKEKDNGLFMRIKSIKIAVDARINKPEVAAKVPDIRKP
jgi:hypothetical protein